jgi:hypothetical protein
MVAAAGAGPAPIDHKALTAQGLADAIRFCLSLDSQRAAASIAARMGSENGVSNAAASFYRHIPWEAMQCDLLPSETAKWSLTVHKKELKLSQRAMMILSHRKIIEVKNLRPYVFCFHAKIGSSLITNLMSSGKGIAPKLYTYTNPISIPFRPRQLLC